MHSVLQRAQPFVPQATTSRPKTKPAQRIKKDLSLAVVLERARDRLRTARGGNLAARPGLVSEKPVIVESPTDRTVTAGQNAEFAVEARVSSHYPVAVVYCQQVS